MNTETQAVKLPAGFKLTCYIRTIRYAIPAITETCYAVENLRTHSFVSDCQDTPEKAIKLALRRIIQ